MAKATRDILLQIDDLEAARKFYQDVLGLTPFMETEQMIGFDAGGLRLFLDRGPRSGPVHEFLVPDLAAARAALLAAGCVIDQEDPAIPRSYVRDPFGLIFNIGEKA